MVYSLCYSINFFYNCQICAATPPSPQDDRRTGNPARQPA